MAGTMLGSSAVTDSTTDTIIQNASWAGKESADRQTNRERARRSGRCCTGACLLFHEQKRKCANEVHALTAHEAQSDGGVSVGRLQGREQVPVANGWVANRVCDQHASQRPKPLLGAVEVMT